MITELDPHWPVQIAVTYRLDPSDLEGGGDLARQIAGNDLFTLPAYSATEARFRPRSATVRFWDPAGGSWTVIVSGPLVKKDGTPGATSRQCAFKHDDTAPPPTWVVELVEDARERAAQAIKAAS
ncbi:hypothetical protein ACXYTP_23570 [Tsukamurella ocularis]